jgi:dihydroorotase
MKKKGRIAVGYDADFTIVDLKKQHTLKNSLVKSKAGWTPYDGMAVTGALVGTVVRGNWVVWEGELIEGAKGEAARFM